MMGLGLRDDASVFQLDCDRSRVRYGVILLAFEFDPPVAADVLVALNEETVSFDRLPWAAGLSDWTVML